MKKHKDISEAQFIRDLKTVSPDISEEDIEWHLNLSRQTVVENVMMDDPIKELALKAGFVGDRYGVYHYVRGIEGYSIDDELEEFAKLIVEKCADFVGMKIECDDATKELLSIISNEMRAYFGVK